MEQAALFSRISRWTVTTLTRYLREIIDSDENIKNIWVSGEISNLSRPSSGHIYFTLKDATASLKCVIWKSDASRLKLTLTDGLAVDVFGSIGIYETGGVYQLYAEVIHPIGEGVLFQEYLRLKELFEKEGLFLEERKKAIPEFPHKIGVVTSATGAAVRDIISVIERRLPLAEVILSPCQVQGEGAPTSIANAMLKVVKFGSPDVIILARGGGSFEDLWAFNSETVVRAVTQSLIPVITGIGHETDFTLADFAADRRAPTPSVAAEFATPMTYTEIRMNVVNLDTLLNNKLITFINNIKELFIIMSDRLNRVSPESNLTTARQNIDENESRIDKAIYQKLNNALSQLQAVENQLSVLGPFAVLQRGYAMVTKNGIIVKKKAQVDDGDKIQIRVSDGIITAKVNGEK